MQLSRRAVRRKTAQAFRTNAKSRGMGLSLPKIFVPTLSLKQQKPHGRKKG